MSNSAYNDIAEKNPLRYRGYVYDAETGMYYLNQRYYNPEICRFISSDNATVVTLTPEAIGCNKNLFAYCDNNPLIRNDDSGDCWFLANMGVYAAGACIGIATQYICNVGCSLSKGESLIKALNPFSSSSGIDYAAAAISGAIATTKISCMGSAVVNGLLGGMAYSLNCEMNGVKTDPFQFGLSVGIGVISGFVGRDGADAVCNAKKYKSISNISKTLVSKKKIALYTGKLSVIKKDFLAA